MESKETHCVHIYSDCMCHGKEHEEEEGTSNPMEGQEQRRKNIYLFLLSSLSANTGHCCLHAAFLFPPTVTVGHTRRPLWPGDTKKIRPDRDKDYLPKKYKEALFRFVFYDIAMSPLESS